MKGFHIAALAGVAVLGSAVSATAGPCTRQIAEHQAAYDARLNAVAAAGPAATETTSATLHHQPTLNSVARAEANVGDISHAQADAFALAMTRAREADAAGDAEACRKALEDGSAALK